MFLLFQTIAFFFAILALVKSQGYGGFGAYSPFSAGLDAPISQRDPRANTGPVLFPAPPADNGQTSGVVVGASGYGFVPPNQQGT